MLLVGLLLITICLSAPRRPPRGGSNGRLPPPVGARYGHELFDRRGRGQKEGNGKSGGMGRGSGGGMGGSVFWRQWHFPVKTNGSLAVEDEEEEYEAEEYFYEGGGAGGINNIRGNVRTTEDYESDRRPWTDLIPRFRVRVEPLTTLKVRENCMASGMHEKRSRD